MIRQLSDRNTITIPKKILESLGIQSGVLFEIKKSGDHILLYPKQMESEFSEQEWSRLKKLSNETGIRYKSAKDAKKHLKGL